MITRGMSLRWEFFVNAFDTRQQVAALLPAAAADGPVGDYPMREGRHGAFVRELASAVSMFQDRTDTLLDLYSEVLKIIDAFSTCAYSEQAFEALLTKVQKIVDKLNLEGYANLERWVQELDSEIEKALLKRLGQIIATWSTMMSETRSGNASDITASHASVVRSEASPQTNSLNPHIKPSKHEVRIRNQVIYLDPPVEAAKMAWYSQLQEWMGIICHLPRLQTSRHEIGLTSRKADAEEATYLGLVRLSICYHDPSHV